MEEGTIISWLKQQGDPVTVGEGLVEIDTDKATVIYEADADGVLMDVLAIEGDIVPCGQVIARINTTNRRIL
jgi:pyruvate/2-oxoglutarate dehydrogenase complex dihydrolipoamide acyltransferase (E2) component